MADIRFVCTALAGTNKAGIIKPDANGCYETVVGGLNVYNSAGQFYVYDQAAALFKESSQFMRRVSRGCLKAEVGHPKLQPGMTHDQFVHRLLSIHEENVCAFHSEIRLDFDNYKDADGRPFIAIISKVCPSGPHGDMLRRAFENPKENVCFSIRAFTDDYRDGLLTKRILRTCVTFDYVTEPGIAQATKFHSPSLEALVDGRLTQRDAVRALDRLQADQRMGVATEAAVMTGNELARLLGVTGQSQASAPNWTSW